jgi:hypothetical protein
LFIPFSKKYYNEIFNARQSLFSPCPLHFGYLFLRGKLGLGTGTAGRFAKAPAGINVFIGETKRDSAKEGGRPTAPPGPMERPPPRDFAKRSAVPVPCGDFEVFDPLYFIEK